MCLMVLGGVKVLVAGEDMICYKVLTRHGHSPFRKMLYHPGEVMTSELDTEGTQPKNYEGEPYGFHEVNEGLHSFVHLSDAEYEARDWAMQDMAVWRAVIPRGSRYIVGKCRGDASYASDALKLVKRIGEFNDFSDERELDLSE